MSISDDDVAFEQRRTSIDSSWYLSEIITCAILVKPSSAFSLFLFIALSCVFFYIFLIIPLII
jgi:hypothetical protein